MVRLRAHFDGRVLVPEGPVDLPRGKVLEVQVEEVGETMGERGAPPLVMNEATGLPVVKVPAGSRPITSEDVRRAEDEW